MITKDDLYLNLHLKEVSDFENLCVVAYKLFFENN